MPQTAPQLALTDAPGSVVESRAQIRLTVAPR